MSRVLNGGPGGHRPPGSPRTIPALHRRLRGAGLARCKERRTAGIGAAVAVAILAPASVAGQDPDCRLVSVGGYTHSQRFVSRFGPSEYRHYVSGGVVYRCSDGTLVEADSAVVFESDNQVQLYGSVLFEDADTELRADSATYFSSIRQLVAVSRVRVADRATGTVISGENLVYDQASEFRALDRILVYGGAPHATFFVAPAQAEEQAPQQDSGQAGARPPEPDIGQAAANPLEPDSGQARADPPEPDSGQARADPPGPDSAQAGPPPEGTRESPGSETAPQTPEETAEAADTTPPVPYEIDAERLLLEGRRYFRAAGQVRVVRDSLQAFGDSLDYDQQGGAMLVFGDARFEGQGYTLNGATISVTPSSSLREEIVAREDARLSGEHVDMRAPAIRLFIEGGNVERLVALAGIPPLPGSEVEIDTRGLSPGDAARARELAGADTEQTASEPEGDLPRPVVVAQDFRLTGDSIDVLSPRQRLERVVAVGDPRAESVGGDSLWTGELPEVAHRDWMVGDTIVAAFAPPQAPDGAAAADPDTAGAASRLETLTATGSARSFYRMYSGDTTAVGTERRPDLHLVGGDRITIHLDGREVVNMDVEGQTEGWHFEPLPPDSAAADSTGARPDSAAADSTGGKPESAEVHGPGRKPGSAAVHAWSRMPRRRERQGGEEYAQTRSRRDARGGVRDRHDC